MKLILYGILIYFLYKLIFNFIIPVSKATSQIKSKIREAQEQQRRFQQQQTAAQPEPPQKNEAVNDAEYIDFEEVK